MRLHPAVSEQEVLTFLKSQALALWDEESVRKLDEGLKSIAEAMAAVSSIVLPEEAEPNHPRTILA